jgi:hypothetical protein
LHATYPATCIAAEYMAEPFLREEGFTDVQYPPYSPGKWVESFASGDIDIGLAYAAALIPSSRALPRRSSNGGRTSGTSHLAFHFPTLFVYP